MEKIQELNARPGNLIRRCHQIAVAIFLEEVGSSGFDITPVQCTALLAIHSQPGLDQISLVSLIALDRSSVGQVVQVLEAKKLVRRSAGKEDRRTKQLYLTDQGRAVIQTIEPVINRVQKRILSPLGPSEQRQFMTLLSKVVRVHNIVSRAPVRAEYLTKPGHRSRAHLLRKGA
jgi:DNA-binding MarR family transcriptional regulator